MLQFISLILSLLMGLFSTQHPLTPTVPTEPAIIESQPLHSSLYLEGVSTEDVIAYFSEVCLAAEFSDGGDPSLLQRWEGPIAYSIQGDPTPEDIATLESFCQWLNTLEGFPGIGAAGNDEYANLRIHFVPEDELNNIMGDEYFGSDGAVTFWYSDNVINTGTICIRSDIDQYLRNSVILEELYNGLGAAQDTALRPNSIIYSEFSQPQQLTEIDELILRLLYHPRMQCGMDLDACRQVIEELYY